MHRRVVLLLVLLFTGRVNGQAVVPAPAGPPGHGPDGGRRSGQWQVGYADAEITPLPGEAMLAGFGLPRRAEGALAPLRAQALAFRDRRGRRALLFTADVLHFGRTTVDALRARIAKAHGIPASAVCFAASHTHCGPATNFRFNFTAGGLNPWYITRLEETLLKLAERALADLVPAEVSYGACEAQIGLCRRQPKGDARTGWKIGWGPHAEGSYDTHTPILRIGRVGSPSQIVLVGHACHPTSSGVLNHWWPDYPGPMRRRLESALKDARALFAMGCGGDAKVVVRDQATGNYAFADRPEQCETAGTKLADHVLAHLQKGEMFPLDGELDTRLVSGKLSLQAALGRAEIEDLAVHGNPRSLDTWWARQSVAYPDARRALPYDVQTWRLGDLTVIALEGEVCADWGAMARALPATRHAMTIAYANEVAAYIPTARIIREGGYEGFDSHRVYFLPAPLEPKTEVELSTLLEHAVGRLDSGSGPGGPLDANRFKLPRQPATDAEEFERRQASVRARAEWDLRRRQILANVQQLLGLLPGPAFRVPLEMQVVKEEKRNGYTQKTISYQVDPYDRVESYLLVPDALRGKTPAVLALHGTHPLGKAWPAGEGHPPSDAPYARELAQRGFVVLAPDYWPMGHYGTKRYDPYQRGYASGVMKGIWNHLRAIDVLESLPEVDRERIGCMGWSLGGYNTVFLGQFEPRIKAMVSHAGYNSFFDYAASPYGGGDVSNWSLDKHIRRIRTVYENDPRQLPCDFPAMIAALAPRPFLTIAPKHDPIFVLPGVLKCLDTARPIYELLGAGQNLQTRFPDGKHEFAKAEREAAYAFLDQCLRAKPR